MRIYFIFISFLIPISFIANPFKIDFPEKETLTTEDYLEIQTKLNKLNLIPVLNEFYPITPPKKSLWQWSSPLASKDDFFNRISKALHQTMIDPIAGKFPIKHLEKINEGGSNCIVCYVSFNGKYPDLIQSLPKRLEKVGFNGYVFYMIGGFPNPTGKEIQYSGVPYSFKIFTLLEAQKMGFQKVLWIDSSFIPLKDPTPLFQWIDTHGYFLKMHSPFLKFILPKTQEVIQKETGVDVLKTQYISAQVIGFNLKSPLAQEFISEYYKLVEMGYPFLSCFPEEYVYSAIVGKNLKQWTPQPFSNLSFSEEKLKGKDPSWALGEGYFFLQTTH